MSDLPLPEITPLNKPYWSALRDGALVFQACACGTRWLPARSECPGCLRADQWRWTPASGRGRVLSWVVYHTAYHPAFADRLPYNVAIVELAEGPRLITSILAANESLRADLPVELATTDVDGVAIATFAPAGKAS
jgi:uncharacterized protein